MGNCCRPASSMEWGGEDWGSLKSKNTIRKTSVFDESGQGNVEKEKLLGALRASSDANGRVKIRISKKELAELLGGNIGIEKQQQQYMKEQQVGRMICAEQVLLRLIKAREHAIAAKQHHDSHHTHWRPVLQTIPEVN